jgi:hypothetical protein
MWLNSLLSAGFFLGANTYFTYVESSASNHGWLNLGLFVLYLLVWFFIGKFANFLLGTELEDRGYVLTNEVKAENAVAAREEATKERVESIHRMEIVEAQTDDRQNRFISTASPSSSAPRSSNYFLRHWRGNLSLPVSYWINAIILVGVLTIILFAAVAAIVNSNAGLRIVSFASLSTLFFSTAAWFWSMVGVWRSAGHHVEKGGASGWANTARAIVVLGFAGMSANLVNTIPQVKEYGLIAIGSDPIGDIHVEVSPNGQSIIVSGILREGSAMKIINILEAAPGVTLVVLDSNGGRLFEAKQLAHAVQSRNLDTYVEHSCESACTYVFLAGKNRSAAFHAKIGFHQPSFPGLDLDAQRTITRDMQDVYKSPGLPDAFVQRIVQTVPQDMWYPARDELISSNVISHVSSGNMAWSPGTSRFDPVESW